MQYIKLGGGRIRPIIVLADPGFDHLRGGGGGAWTLPTGGGGVENH